MSAGLVWITGASSGLGQALALRYRKAGWRVALVVRKVVQTQAWVEQQGWGADEACVYAADVADEASLQAAARLCLERQGLPDVVIANAGISAGVDLAEAADLPVLREIMQTNVLGLASTFHPFIAGMRQRGSGTLVGMASVAAVRGLPGHAAYCASKAAVVTLCESLRVELQPAGVRVVCVLPGYIATPMTARNPFPMPFLMPAERFADRAYAAIEAGVSRRVIPWQMGIAARVLGALPNWAYDALAARLGFRKPRRPAP